MPESPWLQAAIVGFILVVALPLLWCGQLALLARVSGWARLAKQYESNRQPSGTALRWQSARLGWIGYNRILHFHCMPDGLGITPFALFSTGHPPLFIPWSSLTLKETTSSFFVTVDRFEIELFGQKQSFVTKAGLISRPKTS